MTTLVFPEGIDNFDIKEPKEIIESEHMNAVQAAIVSVEIFSKNLESLVLAHINTNPVSHPASTVSFSNAGLNIDGSPTNVQSAIGNHVLQSADVHAASAITFSNISSSISGSPDDVQDAIDKHIAQASEAHAASSTSFDPSSLAFLSSIDVQAIIEEIATEYVRLDGLTGTITGPITFDGVVQFNNDVDIDAAGSLVVNSSAIFNGLSAFNDKVVITASGKALTVNGDMDVTGTIDPISIEIRPISGTNSFIIKNIGDTAAVITISEAGLISSDGASPADILFTPVVGGAGQSSISAVKVQDAVEELNQNVDDHMDASSNLHGISDIGGRVNSLVGTLSTDILENKTILSNFAGPKLVFYTDSTEILTDADRDKVLEWVTGQNQMEIRQKDFTHSTAAVSGSNTIPASDTSIFTVGNDVEIDDGVISPFEREVTTVNASDIEVDGTSLILDKNAYIKNKTLQNPIMFIDNEGNLEINGLNVRVGGSSTMEFKDNVDMIGNMDIAGNMDITGQLQVSSSLSEISLKVAGDGVVIYSNRVESDKEVIINEDLTATGSTLFGDVYGTHQFQGTSFTLSTTNIDIGSSSDTTNLNFDATSTIIFNKGIQVNGEVTSTGLIDGRDVAADGALLDIHLNQVDSIIKHAADQISYPFAGMLKQYLTQNVTSAQDFVFVSNPFMFEIGNLVQVLDDSTAAVDTSIIDIDYLTGKLTFADNVNGLTITDNARVIIPSDDTVEGNLNALTNSFVSHFEDEFAHGAYQILTHAFSGFTLGSKLDSAMYENNVKDNLEYLGTLQDRVIDTKIADIYGDVYGVTTVPINPIISVHDFVKPGDEVILWDDDTLDPQFRTVLKVDGYGSNNNIELDIAVSNLEIAQNAKMAVVGVFAEKVFYDNSVSDLTYDKSLIEDEGPTSNSVKVSSAMRFSVGDLVAVSSDIVSPIGRTVNGLSSDGYGNSIIQLDASIGVNLFTINHAQISKLHVIDTQTAIDALYSKIKIIMQLLSEI